MIQHNCTSLLVIERLPHSPNWSDLEAIAAIDHEAFGDDGLTAANLRLLCLSGRIYAARFDGQIVGQAVVLGRLDSPGAFLLSLAVTTAWQGKHVGRTLLKSILNDLSELGVPFIELTVDPANVRALKLYESEGFTREHFAADLLGPGKPRIIMRRNLKS